MHVNVRSLFPKIDVIRIWAKTTNEDIMVLSETWLKKFVKCSIDGYTVFRADRMSKGGGVTIYVKSEFNTSEILSITKTKNFELLSLK